MKEHLLCLLLLVAATVNTAYGQDACDNAPVQCSSCPVYTEGGGPVNLLNGTGLELSDADSESGVFPSLQAATVELQTDTADAANVTLTINEAVCEEYNLTCAVVSGRTALGITGNQPITTYQKVLLQVKFNITADEPVIMDRMVALRVSDGVYWSEPAIIVVAVNGINDNPPMISVTPAGLPFYEGNSTGVNVVSSVHISDNDNGDTIVEARVIILNPEDDGYERLSTYNVHTYGISITNGSTLVATGNASSSTYSTILQSIRYFNDAEEPDVTPRIIQFVINDGRFNSSKNVTINIVPINDNSTMIIVSSLPDFTEGDGPLYLFNNTLNLYDRDSNNSVVYIQSFTAYLINGTHNESLMASNSTTIDVEMRGNQIVFSGNQIVFSGNYTLEECQMVARSLVYINTDDELMCPLNRTIQLTVQDERFTSNVTVSLSLIPYNDKTPVITIQYSSVNFTEGSMLGTAVFPNYYITDEDEVCGDNTLQSVEITLYQVDRGEESISIAICNDSGISSGNGYEMYHCDPVDLENITMMMGDMIPINITRQLVDGRIILTITGEASLEIYQDLIELIFYNNTADEPDLVNRNVSLLVNDGENIATAYVNITIIPIPDSPPMLNPDGDPVMTENTGPISVIYNITDEDQLTGHQLISQINISIDNPSTNEVNSSTKEDILLVNGAMLNDTFYSIDCTDCNTLECCVDRVQVIAYNNTVDEPSYPFWRSFTIQIKAVGVPPNYSLYMYNVNISIDLVNDYPPVLQVNGSLPAGDIFITQFIEDGDPVLIFDNPVISDGDVGSNFITSVTIEVDDEGDVTNTMYDWFYYNNTTDHLDVKNTSGLLEISGTATAQEYTRLLSTVRYFNTLEEPNSLYQERNITVTIREYNQSYTAYIMIELVAVNDPAQFNFTDRIIIFYEETRDPVVLFKPTDTIADPDQGYLSYATLTLWPVVHEGDTLSISNTNSALTINSNGTHINISGVADITVYQDILRTATFVNRRVDSPPEQRQVIVNTFDGQDISMGPVIYININTIDDPPLCFFGGNVEQSIFGTVLEFVACEGEAPCGTELCPDEDACFNITDFDSNDYTFSDGVVAIVTIENARDAVTIGVNKSEKLIFADSSKVMEVSSPLFMVQYNISNVSTYTELTELLQSVVYNNTLSSLSMGIRTINVSIYNNTESQQCQVSVNVKRTGRLITVLPNRLQMDPVLNYTEDTGPTLLIPESIHNEFFFNVTPGFNTGYRVTLTIVTGSNDDSGQLILPNGFSASGVTISGGNTSEITVEYVFSPSTNRTVPMNRTVPLESFNEVFRAVQILFSDNAPRSCMHGQPYENCAVLEFVNLDLLQEADHVIRLYVAIEAVNDQPVLTGLTTSSVILDNYLPPEINNGFSISFLVTEQEVMDADYAPYNPDIIGLAVVNVTHGTVDSPAGYWQYKNCSDAEWINITNVSECYPVFIYPEGCIRFHPIVNPARSDSIVTMTIRAWDGTSKDTTCTSGIANHTLPVGADTETFTYHLVYLNRAPFIAVREYNISTNEDTASEAVTVSAIVMALGAEDPEDSELGVAVISVDNSIGYWQYRPDSTGDWMNIPYNSTVENAFLLHPNDSLRFSPTTDIFGSSYITVLAAEVDNMVPLRDRIVNTTSDNIYTSSYSIYSSNISITVVSVLDPPVLDCPTTEVVYHENGDPVYIFEGLTITSVETDYLESATVKLLTEEDIIDMLHHPDDSDFNITMDDPHCITISTTFSTSISVFQHFLRQISFSIQNDTEIEPGIQMHTISLTVTDLFGTNSSKPVEVNITLVNDQQPSISLPEDIVTFIEGSSPLQLFTIAPNITDPDDSPYQRSIITCALLCPNYHDPDFEELSFNSSSLNNVIEGSMDNDCLLLSGNATIEDYEEAFNGIYYHNNMSEPNSSVLQRVLYISVHDGMYYSSNVTLSINIILVNDQPPTIQLSDTIVNNTVSLTDNSSPVDIAPQAVIADEDSGSSTSISYSLNVEILNPIDDEIIFRNDSTDASTTISIDGPTSLEYVQQALREVQYINNARQPTGSYRLLRVDIFDTYDKSGSAFSDTAYVRVEFNFTDVPINNNTPTFIPQVYSEMIPENYVIGSNASQITVCDPDESSDTDTIQLTINDTGVPFELTPLVMISDDCFVSTLILTSSLDYEITRTYNLTIEAADMGIPSLTGMGTVFIRVLDVNDNPPIISIIYRVDSLPEKAEIGSFIANFTVTDADSGVNADYINITSQNVIATNGTLLLAQRLDYEEATEFYFTVTVMNTALPTFNNAVNITVAVENVNDVPAILTFARQQAIFYEGSTKIPLNPGITITDIDSEMFYSATVNISVSPSEDHFSFAPSNDLLPYDCPLANKLVKFMECRFTDAVLLTDSEYITLHNDAVLEDNTLYLNAVDSQYMIYPRQTERITSGASILFWVRKDRVSTQSMQPILAKGNVFTNQNIFSVSCLENNDLQFSYYNSTNHQQNVVLDYNCSNLEDAWHHIGIVLNPDNNYWTITLHVDGIVTDSQEISAPSDDMGQFFIGTDINKQSFFNGNVHFAVFSTLPANNKNDINCAIGCGVTLQLITDTPLYYRYSYDHSTLYVSGMASESVYEEFFNSLYFISTFSELYSDRYVLDFDLVEVSPNETDCAVKTMQFLFEIELFYINEGVPVLRLDGSVSPNYATSFIEEGPPVSLVNVNSLSLTDLDLNPSNYTVTVTLMDPLQGDEERVYVDGNFSLLQINHTLPHNLVISGDTNIMNIEDALRRVVYVNTAEELDGTHRIVEFVVYDDYRNQPLMRSEPATTHITFVPVNDPPEIIIQPLFVNYTEGGDVIGLVDNIMITDNDGSVITTAVINLTAFDEFEEIGIDTNGTDIIAQYSSNYSVIELTGNAIHSEYQQVLATLTYFHSSENPMRGTRIVSIRISDGDEYSEQLDIMIFFESINDAPVLDPNGPELGFKFVTEFVEDINVAISVLSDNFTLLDPDNTSLANITLHLVNAPDGDQEFLRVNFTDSQTVVIDPNSIGSSYIMAFEEVLATAEYVNTAEEPTGGNRNITFIVSDGIDNSISYACVQVSTRNDAPLLDLNGNETKGFNYYTTFIDSGGAIPITNNVIIEDNDEDSVIEYFIIYLRNPVDNRMELITFDPQYRSLECNYTTSSYIRCNVTGLSTDQVIDVLNSISYNNTSNEPSTETRQVDFIVSDGYVQSNTASVFINVTLVNEHSPQFIQDTYVGFIDENQPVGTVVANLEASDNDNGRDGEISYSIDSGNDLEHFFINTSSGVIYTNVILDRENISFYELLVVATDNGDPSRNGITIVLITVLNLNDNVPQFAEDTIFTHSVSEFANISEVIYSISATDGDGDLVIFSSEGGQGIIDVNVDGHITIMDSLDVDNGMMVPVYTINVTISDLGGMTATETFTITVIDENEHPPEFSSDVYTIFVSEGISPGEHIGEEINATDNDITSNLTYSITNSSTNSSTFKIVDGQFLTVAASLDRETEHQYFLTLSVSDGLYNDTVSVTVHVTDINDNAPEFDRPSYNFTVIENTMNFSEFTTASDLDLGRNSQINYFIFDPVDDVIQINSSIGELTLSNPLDFETMQSIVFTIYAVDNGTPSLNSSVEVTITVEDINEETPMFTQANYIANVLEGIANIAVINVTLSNYDDAFVFALEEDFETFVIDPISGEIIATASLDYETNCMYNLTVIATNLEHQDDNGLLQSTAIVEVLVTNIHDVLPVFNQSMYAVSIYENQTVGSLVTIVYATDNDSLVQPCDALQEGLGSGAKEDYVLNSELQYSLNNYTDLFMIDSRTGKITTRVRLDREKSTRYSLPVTVHDAVNASDMTIVNVIVLDLNDNRPYFTSESYSMTVAENMPVGSAVLRVMAEDRDMLDNGTLRYSLPDEITAFNISSITGVIAISEPIDFDNGPTQYNFNVIVHDSASQNGTALVTIEILDENDLAPIVTNVTPSANFSELLTSLQTLSTIVISDEDSFQTISSAELKLVVPDTAVSVSGECRCSDTQDSSTCSPEGCNEFLQLGYDFPGVVTLLRHNVSVILLSLSGTYNISTYTTALRSIEYINIISHPTAEPRTLYVTVNDGTFDSSPVVQSIIVKPFNVYPPVLDLNGISMTGSNFSTSFIERGNPVTIVGTDVAILDDDTDTTLDVLTSTVIEIINPLDGSMEYLTSSQMLQGIATQGNVSHRIVLTGERSFDEYHQILRGLQYTNNMPEPDLTARQIRFTVYQYQHTSEPVYTTVNIVAVNNHGPIIYLGGDNVQNYQTQFPEESMGVPITSPLVHIIDMDSGDDVIESLMIVLMFPLSSDRIFISNTSQFPATITIDDASSGHLTLNGPASIADFTAAIQLVYYYQNTDEEFKINNPLYKFLRVTVSDSTRSGPSSFVTITLIPVNDQQPVFGLDVLKINESELLPVGSVITVLTATDGDTLIQPVTVFTILNDSSPFYVNETTGELTNIQTLDRETFPRPYVLSVQARDVEYNGVLLPGVLTLLIFLEDENDNDPNFTEPLYNASVPENVANGTFVITVTATDGDVDEVNKLIVYEILNNTDFIIDSNGTVKTNAILDRERQDYYELTIIARHPSDINSNGTTILSIYIIDLDDNDPVLTLIPDSGVLQEPTTIVPLSHMLTIIDNDTNPMLSYASVQILPNGSTSPLGQLLSLHNTSSISLEGNGSQMLQYTGNASIQEYEELLRSVVYQDNADEPVPVTRLIEFVIASHRNTSTSSFSLSVTVINDNPPYLTLDRTNSSHPGDLSDVVEGSYFTTFVEEGDPVSITSPYLEITDTDSGINMLSFAVVCIKGRVDNELLNVNVNLTDNIQLSADSNNTWLNLTGPASVEEYENVLRSIRYVNLADEPTGETREMLFYVNDGLFNSNMPSAIVTISRMNDAPVVTLGPNATVDVMLMYLENQSEPLLLAQDIQINDAENDPISFVSVNIDNRLPEEMLTISAAVTGFFIVDTTTGLTVLSTAGVSGTEFENILQTLRYENSRTMGPVQSPRMISFIATDEVGAASMQAFAIINFESIDNPPMIDLNGNLMAGMNFSTVFTEGTSAIPIVNSQATITDVDSEDLYLMVISFNYIPDLTYENVSIQNTGVMSIERHRDNNSLYINITGQMLISNYLLVLTSVHYINTADEPTPGQREICIQVYSRNTNGDLTASNTACSLISITHVNDHSPVFSRDVYYGSVLENTTGIQVIVTVSATDSDRYGNTNIMYRLPPDVVDFVIDPVTGVITTNDTMLDREAEEYVTFTVWALDNDIDMRTGTATVNITVLDVNDNCPMFSLLTFTPPIVVRENSSIGSIIASVTATDIDAGINSEVTYHISSRPSVSDSGSGVSNVEPFGVVTENSVANLLLVTSLDREAVSEYTITIEATDGNCTVTMDIAVNVSDVNDNPIVFTNLPANLTLSEATPTGIAVYQVTAEDADLNAVIQFSLLTFTHIFTINATTGAISLNNSLDYEQTREYVLNIQASDSIMTAEETLFITISNINEPPQFNPDVYNVEAEENSLVTITLNASDPENDVLAYAFSDVNGATRLFNINPSTGVVSSAGIDYEKWQQINLTVRAIDPAGNFSIANISITVLDMNDNVPIFNSTVYSINLSENTSVNSLILTVTATDADFSSNGLITYGIDNVDQFGINPSNGTITLLSPLDFEATRSYNLIVTAADAGTPSLTGSATVQVNIIDENDERPVLTISTTQVTYTENSNEILVAADLAIEDDDSPLHPLMGAAVVLDVGECRLSSDELQEACQQQEPTCTSYCAERLTFDRSLLDRYGLTEQPTSTDHAISITGNASESSYQEILRSVAYINLADEPYAGNRIVSFQVTDDQNNTDRVGESNTVYVTVQVELIDEYCPVVSSELNTATFVEGSSLTYVGQNVMFSITDRDREPHNMLNMLEIRLRNRQAEETISVAKNGSLLVTLHMNGSDLVIRIQGAATVELYRQTLQTLTYNNTQDEPTLNERSIIISPSVVGNLPCTAHNITINVTPVNDNPPVLTVDVQTVEYTEESGTLSFAQSAGLHLADHDHNDIFNMVSAEVVLTNVRNGNSEIIEFSTPQPDGVDLIEDNHLISINYSASVSAYNSLLSNLIYRNGNPEPTPGMRIIELQVYDGVYYANATIFVVVLNINDNRPYLAAGSSTVVLREGTTEVRVGLEAMLVLMDRDGEISSLRVTLSNRLDQSEEIRIANSSSINSSTNETSVYINGIMPVSRYQNILDGLVYSYPQAIMEPLPGNRTITISASDDILTSTLSITLLVELINNHNPIVDLNGPTMDGLNYSTSVNFNRVVPNKVAIVSPNVNITDGDTNAFINKLEIRLHEESEDLLIVNLPNCQLPPGVAEISCQITTDSQFACVCDNNLMPSQDLRTLTVNLTQKVIIAVQPQDLVSFETFQYLLSLIWFQHNPAPPNGNYTSTVSVVVFDGQLYSQPVFTTVTVRLLPANPAPIVAEDGITNNSIVIKDGTTSTLIATNAVIANSNAMLQGMIVTLTNVIHDGDEYLSVNHEEPNITLGTSSSDENLVFVGIATVRSYAMLLQNISYNYNRMSSIIDNTPNLTPRIIIIETVDMEGQQSHPAQVTLVLDDICSQTREGDTVTIAYMRDFELLSNCRGLELDLNIRPADTTINSLRLLSHLRSVRRLTINSADVLTNLEGLENLKSYTSLEIINNERLTTLQHLSSNYAPLGLTVKSVYVSTNPRIRDIVGLQNIVNVTGDCYIYFNGMLNDLSGLNNMLEVGNLAVFYSPRLTDLNVANNLWKANSIGIIQNMALESVTGFQQLREIHTLVMEGNTRLVHFDGFGGILSVYSVMIQSNPALCYILNETPNRNYWEGLGAQETTDITISSSCTQRNCSASPCYNGGQCVMTTATSYSCMCTGTGYYNGNDLQGCLFFNACQSEPCQNGGSCALAELDLLGYRCSCPPGFTGTNCTFDINDCDPNPCMNDGTCIDGIDAYSCTCTAGYTSDNCSVNIDDCNPNPCMNGTCVDLINDYSCACLDGFTGGHCDLPV